MCVDVLMMMKDVEQLIGCKSVAFGHVSIGLFLGGEGEWIKAS